MWLITTFGFFSIVDKQAGKSAGVFTVRSRVRQDLERLKSSYLPELTEIVVGGGTDYRYRGTAPKQAVARAFGDAIADIDYSNFKNSVALRQGHPRHDAYAKVWQNLNDDLAAIDHADAASPKARVPKAGVATPPAKKVLPGAAGGVVFDKLGRLILREPKGHFGDYVWTYGKGRVQSGESHERTALREVLEETGAKAEIVDCIGDFPGDTSVTRFFLMRLVHDTGVFQARETEAVRWVTPQEAKPLIAQTTSPTGRKRDLAVLAAATELWQKHANR